MQSSAKRGGNDPESYWKGRCLSFNSLESGTTQQSPRDDAAAYCTWKAEHWTKEGYLQALKSNGIFALLNFELAWDHHPFLLILFEMRMCIICLSHCGILRARNLSDFNRFTAASGWINHTSNLTISDLDDIQMSWCWNELRALGLLGWNECILHAVMTRILGGHGWDVMN